MTVQRGWIGTTSQQQIPEGKDFIVDLQRCLQKLPRPIPRFHCKGVRKPLNTIETLFI